MTSRLLITILFFVFTACKPSSHQAGGGGGASSGTNTTKCDVTTAAGPLCYEYTGLPDSGVSVAKASCEDNKGSFTAKATCSRANSVGGCTQGGNGNASSAGKLVIYVYSPSYTADKVKQLCQNENEQYVAP